MYSINQSTVTTTGRFILAGIQENVSITDIAVEDAKKDGSGGKVLRLHLEDQNGGTFTHTEFEPRLNTSGFGAKRDPKEQLKKDIDATMSRIKHILAAFVPAGKIEVSGNSWEDLLNKVVAVAGNAYTGRLFRIKLVLNSKDYPCFPRYVREGFIEPMEIAKSLMRINEKFDRTEPKEASSEDEMGSTATTSPSSDMGMDPEFAPDNVQEKVMEVFASAEVDNFDNMAASQEDDDDLPF